MSRSANKIFQSIEELIRLYDADSKEEQHHVDRLERYSKRLKKHFGQFYVDKLSDVRKKEGKKKIVTSVAIHEHNQKFIQQLQSEAKEHYFTLSKENIVNIALCCLEERFVDLDCDVGELVDSFY